jgi:hypothetical protein
MRPVGFESLLLDQSFDRFSVYGFSLDYLKGLHVEFNPRSKEGEGDVVFHFPDKTKIFLSWGNLEKASGFSTVEEHANHSLDKIRTAGNVRNFERISQQSFEINSHQGIYSRAKFDEITISFVTGKSKHPREGHSVHVHCQNSARFFVVYAILPSEGTYEYEEIFSKMSKSLKCH